MPDNAESLEELKRTLLSLVCSNPSRMDVNCLKRDFADQERDGNIPIHKYGHNNLITFLTAECNDIFKFQGNPHNPFLIPIVKEEIKVLNELVVKQKTAINKSHLVKRSKGFIESSPNYKSGYGSNYGGNGNEPNRNYNYAHKNGYQNWNMQSSQNRSYPSYNNNNPGRSPTKPHSNYKPKPLVSPRERSVELFSHYINPLVWSNLKKLIDSCPEGLFTHELMNAYERKYNINLPLENMGYNSIVMLCKNLPEVFKMVRPTPLGDWGLYGMNVKMPARFQKVTVPEQQIDHKEHHPVDCEEEIFGTSALPGLGFDPSLYPKECVEYGVALPCAPTLNPDEKMNVMVAEVRDPSYFWFQICSPNHSFALEDLMDQMDDMYKKTPPPYVMTRAAARVGQLVAAPYNNRFHRAIILMNVTYEVVKIRYLDYGTVANIDAKDIRMLHRDFVELPCQVYRGRLYKTMPSGINWSSEARARFLELVSDKVLEIDIREYNETNLVYELLLLDWKNPKVKCVGDLLKTEGLATEGHAAPLVSWWYPQATNIAISYNGSETDSDFDTDAESSGESCSSNIVLSKSLGYLNSSNRTDDSRDSYPDWEDEISHLDSASQVGLRGAN